MRKFSTKLIALGLIVSAALSSSVQADEASPEVPPTAESLTKAYTGPLTRPSSPAYYLLRSPTSVRLGPSTSYPVVSDITVAAKPLQALGMAFDGDPNALKALPEEQSLSRMWIKVQLPAGGSGFVNLADLVTPQQMNARAGSSKKIGLLEAAAAAAKRTTDSDIPSGLYAHGGSCDASDMAPAAFLQGKALIWQDGSRMHFVTVLQPDDPTLYDIQNDNQVRELQGFGYVPMRTFRSSKDTLLMGYKDRLLWFTTDGNRFDSYQACDADGIDVVMSMIRSYAGQRPPEAH
jgi:hypothetical protein